MLSLMNKIRLNEFFCDNLWRWKCGLPEIDYNKRDKLKFGSQKDTFDNLPDEFTEIIRYADNRMHQGKFRYGKIKRQNLGNYDTAIECIKRIQKYILEGRNNLEYIVDALNMCRIEYYKGRLLGEQIIPIDDGEHAEEINC